MKKIIKFLIIIFIFSSSIYLMNTTKSRYASGINIKNNVNVAVPIIELDTSTLNSSLSTILPGDSRSCEFSIRNNKDSKINEVLMSYYINLDITNQGLPLTYKIYDMTNGTEQELTQTSNGFGPITLNYGQEQNSRYKITFTWDESQNSDTLANQNFSFKVLVNATQEI